MTQAVVQVRNIVARSGFANPLTLEVLVTDEDYLKVYADTTLLDNGADYAITGIGDPNGVSIEIIGAEDVDEYVGVITFTALYDPPLDQQGSLAAGGVLGRSFESALDQQNRRLQATNDKVGRSIRLPPNMDVDGELPWPPTDEYALMWDEDLQQVVWADPSGTGVYAAAAAASAAEAAASAVNAGTEADAAAASAAAAAIAETAAELAETSAEAAEVAAEAAQAAAEAAAAASLPLTGSAPMTGPIRFTHQASPANPAAGLLALFAKSDNRFYTRTSAGVETALGSGVQINVKDYGASGDGVTNDTTAILAAETVRAAAGGELIFPPGDYLTDGTSINRANGGVWRGIGRARLLASANNTIICNLSGAVMTSAAKAFRITGLVFDGNGFTGVRAVNENGPHMTQFDHCVIKQVQFAGSFIGANVVTQHGWIQIHDIIQYGAGSWAFYGYDNTKYLFHIEINNIHQVGTGAANWESQFWFEGRRAVGLSMTNVWSGSLDGDADGLLLRGDCQGVFLANCTFVWPITGIRALTWTDSLKPAYVYMSNVAVDQHTESGADIEGRTWFISNANFANGYVRTNSGSGCILQSTCTDITLSNTLFAYDQKSGLVIETGATKIKVNGCTLENNNQVAGAFYDLDLQASTYTDVVLYGRNAIAGAVNATGQRVVNGVTSKEVSRNTGSVGTTAVTTQEDLMTYSIAASTLKIGQKVRLTAWGTFAANANTKTPRLWFGANSVMDWGGAHNNIPWKLTADILITGVDTQEYNAVGFVSASAAVVRQGTATNDDGAAIVVKCTGQNGTANANDIVCQGFTVEILD
jgi:hypothetical protein